MSNDYGKHTTLSYNKYLKVPDLIGLQECLSDPLHHDELLFITIHQAYELWFKQILHELDAAMVTINEDRLAAAAQTMRAQKHTMAEISTALGISRATLYRHLALDAEPNGRAA